MKEFYEMQIAGLTRRLPICKLTQDLCIAGFVIFGDPELTVAEHDYMITAEAKGIPLIHEMARQAGEKKYILARKAEKVYMRDVFHVTVNSITTRFQQTLFLDGADAALMKGKKILVVDDVISTGESLRAIEALVEAAGGTVCGRMTILAEGEAANRDDIVYLEKLPMFNSEGEPLE